MLRCRPRWQTRRGTTPKILPSAVRVEADLIRGGAAAKAAVFLREKGFDPALIIGHPGWGETTYMREIFPRAKQIVYAEYYYRSVGGDVGSSRTIGRTSSTRLMRWTFISERISEVKHL